VGYRRFNALLALFFVISLPVVAQNASLDEAALLQEKQDNIRALEIELLELKIEQQKSQLEVLQDKQQLIALATESEQKGIKDETEKPKQDKDNNIKIRLGMSVGLSEAFEVVDTSSSAGQMYASSNYTPFLGVESPYLYFSEKSRWGAFLDFSIREFDFNRQEVDYKNFVNRKDNYSGDIVNLGTNVEGEKSHLSAIIFFNPSKNKEAGVSMLFGAGLGMSHIRAKGDIVITENESAPTNERLNVNYNDRGLHFKMFMDARLNNWFATALLQISSGNERDIAFSYVGYAINMGYMFEL